MRESVGPTLALLRNKPKISGVLNCIFASFQKDAIPVPTENPGLVTGVPDTFLSFTGTFDNRVESLCLHLCLSHKLSEKIDVF